MAKKYGAAAVAYVFTWLSGLIVYLLTNKADKHTRFHAAQAILLGIAITVVTWAFMIFFGLGALLGFVLYIVGLYAAYKAYNGEKFKLPLLGDLAEKMSK